MHRYAEIIAKLRSIQSRSKGELLKQAADALEQLQKEQEEERYRHDRLQDFEVAESEPLRQMTIERNMLARKLREVEEPDEDDFDLESALEADRCYECGAYGDDYFVDAAPAERQLADDEQGSERSDHRSRGRRSQWHARLSRKVAVNVRSI